MLFFNKCFLWYFYSVYLLIYLRQRSLHRQPIFIFVLNFLKVPRFHVRLHPQFIPHLCLVLVAPFILKQNSSPWLLYPFSWQIRLYPKLSEPLARLSFNLQQFIIAYFM